MPSRLEELLVGGRTCEERRPKMELSGGDVPKGCFGGIYIYIFIKYTVTAQTLDRRVLSQERIQTTM